MFASTVKPERVQLLDQGVAVAGPAEEQQAGRHERAASQLLAGAGEDVVEAHGRHNSV